jgi:hypothetical protein
MVTTSKSQPREAQISMKVQASNCNMTILCGKKLYIDIFLLQEDDSDMNHKFFLAINKEYHLRGG